MKKLTATVLFILFCPLALFSSLALADEVRIPIGEQSDDPQVQKPSRGISSAAVERQFGSPESKHGPVGEPPIHYWEYESFTVYFEHDHVIHAVSKFKSKEVLRK